MKFAMTADTLTVPKAFARKSSPSDTYREAIRKAERQGGKKTFFIYLSVVNGARERYNLQYLEAIIFIFSPNNLFKAHCVTVSHLSGIANFNLCLMVMRL